MAFFSYFEAPSKELTRSKRATLRENLDFLKKDTTLSNYSIALLGLPDNIHTEKQRLSYKGTHCIREQLYGLAAFSNKTLIVDLGNLKLSGHQAANSQALLSEILQTILKEVDLVILFGGTHEFELGQYKAYEGQDKQITLLSVDNRINLSPSPFHTYGTQLDDIFAYYPNYLFHYIHLAHQSYLVSKEVLRSIDKLQFEAIRLGTIRESLRDTEAFLRQANLIAFDGAALSKNYTPAAIGSEIFGLSGEEACQIAWYAGSSEQLSSLGVYGYAPTLDDTQRTTAMTFATMIWYAIDGFLQRSHTLPFNKTEYMRYVVDLPPADQPLIFYKSMLKEKWWMEVPFKKNIWAYNAIVPCSFEDYILASQGEVPKRWLLMYNKMN